jgi:hypothetical protein
MKRNQFEMSTCGNVLSEILREVERATKALKAGNIAGAEIYLEYIGTIVDDACEQHGGNQVFGLMEISEMVKNNLASHSTL